MPDTEQAASDVAESGDGEAQQARERLLKLAEPPPIEQWIEQQTLRVGELQRQIKALEGQLHQALGSIQLAQRIQRGEPPWSTSP